ncbi:helix-turn-helix domain-containing protein [Nevskia sp.]|uniref:helix-turn-helix domain-containing protein n=1 Tax=Nevskia sp. TaxID=1929292 RepID=UPI003F6F71E6
MDGFVNDVPAPGLFIREELEARGWTQSDLAYVLGIAESELSAILAGKRGITPERAKAFGKAFDVAAELFANLQNAYDLSRAREPDPNVERKARLQSVYPIRDMIKRGWLIDSAASLLEAQLASFFEASSINEVPQLAHAAMKSNYGDVPAAQLAWLYRVRQIAKEMVVPAYSEKALRKALAEMKQYMIDPADTRHVARLLSECGIRYVVVEALPNSKIDGVCFWIDDSPVIGMSILKDRIDNFWFVLRHEIEHVLQGDGRDLAIIDSELEGAGGGTGSEVPEQERNANKEAADYCVPIREMESFFLRKNPFFSERDLLGFAKRMQVHPGIVAGQLRRRLNRWDLFSKHLVKIRQSVLSTAMCDGWGQVAPLSN